MGPRSSISKAYTIPLEMQSHCLSMTPVSIKQLRATLQQKSIRIQNAVRDKTGGQSQNIGANSKLTPTNYMKI
jgi:hypothetical protein